MTTQHDYLTDKWTNELMERVGMNDLAVKLNERFAHDILVECEKEYERTQDLTVFNALNNLQKCFKIMINKSLKGYNQYLFDKSLAIAPRGQN
jgi:hypothetical protein